MHAHAASNQQPQPAAYGSSSRQVLHAATNAPRSRLARESRIQREKLTQRMKFLFTAERR